MKANRVFAFFVIRLADGMRKRRARGIFME